VDVVLNELLGDITLLLQSTRSVDRRRASEFVVLFTVRGSLLLRAWSKKPKLPPTKSIVEKVASPRKAKG
jgi:hypothetical protein